VWGLDLDGSRGGLGGIGGLLWIVSQANGTHYAAPDGSGNVVALFGTGGTETARYEYGPFGELLRMSGGAIAAENPWRYSCKRQDPTTEWVHYEYRVYDPASGRWLSRDPIGEAGGENLYGFVGNDPVNRVDPDGRDSTTLGGNNAPPALTLICDPKSREIETCWPPLDAFTRMFQCAYESSPFPGIAATWEDWAIAFDEEAESIDRNGVTGSFGTRVEAGPRWVI
jgi:RHS repeat-associated protein